MKTTDKDFHISLNLLLHRAESLVPGSFDIRDVVQLFIPAVKSCQEAEVAHLAERVGRHAGLSKATMNAVVKQAQSFKEGYGYVTNKATAAAMWVEGIRKELGETEGGIPLMAWSGFGLHTYEEGYYRRSCLDQVVAAIRIDFDQVPLLERTGAARDIAERVRAMTAQDCFFDDAVAGVNMADGFVSVDLMTGSLVRHDPHPRFKARHKLPVGFDPEADPEWVESGIARVLPEEMSRRAFQEVAGALIFGVEPTMDRARRIIVCKGQRNSGKSTCIDALKIFVPEDRVGAVPPERCGNEYYLAALDGLDLNVVSELEKGKISSRALKTVGSGELIAARQPGGEVFYVLPKALHLFATNELIRVDDSTDAFERRVMVIPFNRSLADGDRDPKFLDKLKTERFNAFVKWAAQGVVRLSQNGRYTLPQGHLWEAARMQYGDDVAAILVNRFVESAPGDRITTVQFKKALAFLARRTGTSPNQLNSGTMKQVANLVYDRHDGERGKTRGEPFYRHIRFTPAFLDLIGGPEALEATDPETGRVAVSGNTLASPSHEHSSDGSEDMSDRRLASPENDNDEMGDR